MKTLIFALGVLLAFAFVGLFDARAERDGAKQRITILQADLAAAKLARKTDSIEVVRTITRVRLLRDTLNIHDTVQVKEYIQRTVEAERAAEASLASASAESRAADTLVKEVLIPLRARRFAAYVDGAREVIRHDVRVGLGGEVRVYRALHLFAEGQHTIGRDSSLSRLWVGGRVYVR